MKKICYSCLCAVIVISMIVSSIPVVAAGDTSPIIFIPGIMGSRLFTSEECKISDMVWPPSASTLFTFADSLVMENDLYVIPPVNMTDEGAKREYGSLSSYKDTIDGLCEEFADRDVYFFSYDFRQSNEISSAKLAEFIDSLGVDKVSLVSHSMGGIVSALYADNYGYGKIAKIISCGTPYEGSPTLLQKVCTDELLSNVLSDEITDKLLGVVDVLLDRVFGLDRELKTSFPGCAEIAPSFDYLKEYPMYKYSSFMPSFFVPQSMRRYRVMSTAANNSLYRMLFTENYRSTQSVMKKLDEAYKTLTAQDNAYFICGISQPTVTSLKISGHTKNTMSIDDVLFDYSGDGTVPLASANILSSLDSSSANVLYVNTDHGGTCSSQKAFTYICDILRSGISSVTDDEQTVTEYRVYKIKTEQNAKLVDENEKTVASNDIKEQSAITSYNSACVKADGYTYFCVPETDDYKVVTDEPCEMTVKTFEE